MNDVRMAIIDGTGEWDDAGYTKSMAKSFCTQIGQQLGSKSYYQRGPWIEGGSDASKMDAATAWLKLQRQIDPKVRLMLAGYSRGGTVAIAAAERLEAANLPVDALFLFDAVARNIMWYGRVIPANVKVCRYAQRSHDPAFVDKYEKKYNVALAQLTNPFSTNPTRPSFGNTGLTHRGSTLDFNLRTFLGTHGALGGVGWPEVPEDPAAQVEVAAWMTGEMRAQGVAVTLVSTPPS